MDTYCGHKTLSGGQEDLANIHPHFKPRVLGVFPTHLPMDQMHCEKSMLSPILAVFALISYSFSLFGINPSSNAANP